MRGVKNLKVMAAGLCLGVTLLTGCGKDRVTFIDGTSNPITLVLEEGKTSGMISYGDLCEHVKIVTFENVGNIQHYLLVKVLANHSNYKDKEDVDNYDFIRYSDLKTGCVIMEYNYYYNVDKKVLIFGEDLIIKDVKDITSYLVMENFVKREYCVEEIFTFFEEKIKPTLSSSEKELVK